MFNLFRSNPIKKLQAEYARKLEEARDLQRKGDIKGFSQASADADAVLKKLEEAESAATD